jgi:hypothetical protein
VDGGVGAARKSLIPDRKNPHPYSGRSEYGIGDSGRDRRHTGLHGGDPFKDRAKARLIAQELVPEG